MVVILFRSRLTAAAGTDYTTKSDELENMVRTFDGFVDVRSYTAPDGERLTVVWWRDLESLKKWRNDPTHAAAQGRGRKDWYEFYKLEVAEIVRDSNFQRIQG